MACLEFIRRALVILEWVKGTVTFGETQVEVVFFNIFLKVFWRLIDL